MNGLHEAAVFDVALPRRALDAVMAVFDFLAEIESDGFVGADDAGRK